MSRLVPLAAIIVVGRLGLWMNRQRSLGFRRAVICGCTLLLLIPSRARAQAPSRTGGAAACLKAAAEFMVKANQAAHARKQPLDPVVAKRQQLAEERRCAAPLAIATTPSGELLTLARLYTEIGNDTLARRAIAARLATPGLVTADRADAMVSALALITVKADPSRVLQAESLAHELDALDPSATAQKVSGHARLMRWYANWGYADESQRVRYHATAVLDFGRQLPTNPPSPRGSAASLGPALINASWQLANMQLSAGNGDSALGIARALRRDHPEIPQAEVDQTFAMITARAGLIGQRAPPLQASTWFNAAPGTTQVELAGKVTVIQFTAHWCIPCRDTYPGFVATARKFAGADVQLVFLTNLFGYFTDFYKKIPPAVELAALRKYYLDEHGISFMVGVWQDPAHPGEPFDATESDPNRQHYAQGAGFPGFVVIDGRGVIRYIYNEWTIGAEQQLPELIASLLAEKRQ